MSEIEDLVIIGSGPAGYTAAIYSARANLKPLIFEGFSMGGVPGGQLMTTTLVENYPGFEKGIAGPDLMGAMRAQAEGFGARYLAQDVTAVDFSHRPFRLTTDEGEFSAKAVIVATGATARYLGVAGEQRLLNRGVSACATCDGALPIFRNKEILVVGGGDSAMEEAVFLTRFASRVWLVHRRPELRASKIMAQKARANPKISFILNTVLVAVQGDEQVSGVRLRDIVSGSERDLPVAGVFVAVGHTPNTSIFTGQLELDAKGYIVTRGRSTYTNIEGIFACGDVQDPVYRQAISAAGSGCQAAIDAERWLESVV